MRQIPPHNLWIGHAGDARDLRAVRAVGGAGIVAIVDLAAAESPLIGSVSTGSGPMISRDMVYCRFPICDGAGNERWMVRAAIETAAGLLRSGTLTLIFCGAGMSRSPAIAAGAMALVGGRDPGECLREIARGGPCDVSAGMWDAVVGVVAGCA